MSVDVGSLFGVNVYVLRLGVGATGGRVDSWPVCSSVGQSRAMVKGDSQRSTHIL